MKKQIIKSIIIICLIQVITIILIFGYLVIGKKCINNKLILSPDKNIDKYYLVLKILDDQKLASLIVHNREKLLENELSKSDSIIIKLNEFIKNYEYIYILVDDSFAVFFYRYKNTNYITLSYSINKKIFYNEITNVIKIINEQNMILYKYDIDNNIFHKINNNRHTTAEAFMLLRNTIYTNENKIIVTGSCYGALLAQYFLLDLINLNIIDNYNIIFYKYESWYKNKSMFKKLNKHVKLVDICTFGSPIYYLSNTIFNYKKNNYYIVIDTKDVYNTLSDFLLKNKINWLPSKLLTLYGTYTHYAYGYKMRDKYKNNL